MLSVCNTLYSHATRVSMPHRLLKFAASSLLGRPHPEPRMFRSPNAPQGWLRRRHHRRRRPRPRRRVLPGARSWHSRYRGARKGLPRRRQHRAQHHHHPLELPHARRREVLRRAASRSGRALPRSSTSTCSIPRAGISRWRIRMRTCAPRAGAPRSTSISACAPRWSTRPS